GAFPLLASAPMFAFAFWQVLVGCTLVECGRRRDPGSLVLRRNHWLGLVAAAVLALLWLPAHVILERQIKSRLSAGDIASNPVDGLRYRWIPGGVFTMGCSDEDGDCQANEMPSHRVEISKGFWLGEIEVPSSAWEQVKGKLPPSGGSAKSQGT